MMTTAVVDTPIQPPLTEPCPQCNIQVRTGTLFTRDACGHKKCRSCVLFEGEECGSCCKGKVSHSTADTKGPPSDSGGNAVSVTQKENLLPNGTTEDTKLQPVTAQKKIKEDGKNCPSQRSSNPSTVADKIKATLLSDEDSQQVDDPDFEPSRENGSEKKKRNTHPDFIVVLPGSPTRYHCTVCDRKFKSRSTVIYHSFCGSDKKKPHTCELCNKGFISKQHLLYHIRDHMGDKPFVCDVCGKGFKQRVKLNRHSVIHTGKRKHECDICGKRFIELSGLRKHRRLHTGELPFKCKDCGKAFNESSNYQKHVRSLHKEERPYICEMCGKAFAWRQNLGRHQRRHGGIRPYECSVCSMRFSCSMDLSRHKLIHQPSLRPFKCPKCPLTFRRKDNMQRHDKHTHGDPEKPTEASPDDPQAKDVVKPMSKEPIEEQASDDQSNAETAKAPVQQPSAVNSGASDPADSVGSSSSDAQVSALPAAEECSPSKPEEVGTRDSDDNSSKPLRKRRVRPTPLSLPLFHPNVTPPPGALAEPPRHCPDRRVQLRPPVPVDFRRKNSRSRPQPTGDIKKDGFIQVPQYPPKVQAKMQSKAALSSSAVAKTCSAVPVITRPQPEPSNCVRTITKTPQQPVTTIVSPRNPASTAPPLPPLPATSPHPDQPMLRLLLHDTPCSNRPQSPPQDVELDEELGLYYAYEYLVNSGLNYRPTPAPPPAKGFPKKIPDNSFPTPANAAYSLDDLDSYCRQGKKFLPPGKGKGSFCDEELLPTTYCQLPGRPGKKMSAISDRFTDDDDYVCNSAINYSSNYTTEGFDSDSGKRIPDPYPPRCSQPAGGYRSGKNMDVLDMFSDYRTGGDMMAVAQDLSMPSFQQTTSATSQQPPVIVGTGKLSNVMPYS